MRSLELYRPVSTHFSQTLEHVANIYVFFSIFIKLFKSVLINKQFESKIIPKYFEKGNCDRKLYQELYLINIFSESHTDILFKSGAQGCNKYEVLKFKNKPS